MGGLYLAAILAYIALLWLTGYVSTRKSRSAEAYLIASRSLSTPLVSVLVAGTWIGGVSIVGMAQGAYIHGISALWFQAGIWMAMVVTALLLDRIVGNRKTYSILDVVGSLYDRRTARLAGIMQLVFSIWVITMQIVGGGAVLSFIMKGRITFGQGMMLTALVFTLYNVMGGMVATAYTNLIHLGAIFLGIFAGGVYVLLSTDALSRMTGAGHYFAPFGDLGVSQALSWAYINLTLGVLAQPVINSASSARTLKQGRWGILIGNALGIPVVVMAALCGIAAQSLFPGAASLSALPSLLGVLPAWIGVFFLLAMWAPLMSSGSPFLMGATTLAVKGYIIPLFNLTGDRRLLMVSRFTTVGIGCISLLLGFFVKEILREVTWLAVLLSAIVYVVFFGWIRGGKAGSGAAFLSLAGTIVLLVVIFLFRLHRVVHPIWPVTVFVFLVMSLTIVPRRKTSSPSSSGDPPPLAEQGFPPWGNWRVLDDQMRFKVKRIEVLPGKRLSYQKHFKREEHWQIVTGQARVTLEGQELLMGDGDCIHIAREALHRIENTGEEMLVFIEVQKGDYFGEDDIVRVEDDYGRL